MRVKLAAFVISGFVTGVVGGLWFYFIGQALPETVFDPAFDLTVALMAFLGGFGTPGRAGARRAHPGAAAAAADPAVHQRLPVADLLGALFLLVILFLPRGLIPERGGVADRAGRADVAGPAAARGPRPEPGRSAADRAATGAGAASAEAGE